MNADPGSYRVKPVRLRDVLSGAQGADVGAPPQDLPGAPQPPPGPAAPTGPTDGPADPLQPTPNPTQTAQQATPAPAPQPQASAPSPTPQTAPTKQQTPIVPPEQSAPVVQILPEQPVPPAQPPIQQSVQPVAPNVPAAPIPQQQAVPVQPASNQPQPPTSTPPQVAPVSTPPTVPPAPATKPTQPQPAPAPITPQPSTPVAPTTPQAAPQPPTQQAPAAPHTVTPPMQPAPTPPAAGSSTHLTIEPVPTPPTPAPAPIASKPASQVPDEPMPPAKKPQQGSTEIAPPPVTSRATPGTTPLRKEEMPPEPLPVEPPPVPGALFDETPLAESLRSIPEPEAEAEPQPKRQARTQTFEHINEGADSASTGTADDPLDIWEAASHKTKRTVGTITRAALDPLAEPEPAPLTPASETPVRGEIKKAADLPASELPTPPKQPHETKGSEKPYIPSISIAEEKEPDHAEVKKAQSTNKDLAQPVTATKAETQTKENRTKSVVDEVAEEQAAMDAVVAALGVTLPSETPKKDVPNIVLPKAPVHEEDKGGKHPKGTATHIPIKKEHADKQPKEPSHKDTTPPKKDTNKNVPAKKEHSKKKHKKAQKDSKRAIELPTDVTQNKKQSSARPHNTDTPTKSTDATKRTSHPQKKHSAPKAPSGVVPAGGGNLDALRARVMEASSEEDIKVSHDAAVKRMAALTGSDLKDLQETTDSVSDKKLDDSPTTKHAAAIAGVAQTLQELKEEHENAHADTDNAEDTTAKQKPPVAAQNANKPTQPENQIAAKTKPVSYIRTFRSDVEKTMTEDKVSVVKMIADTETKRHENEGVVRRSRKRNKKVQSSLLIGAAVVFTISAVAIGVVLATIAFRPHTVATTGGLFLANSVVEYDASGQDRAGLLRGLTSVRDTTSTGNGNVTEVLLSEQLEIGSVETGPESKLTTTELIERLGIRAPNTMTRSLSESYVFGIHEVDETAHPFFVFRTSYREGAFTGMLAWEYYMDTDLAPLFGPALQSGVPEPVEPSGGGLPALSDNPLPADGFVDTLTTGSFEDITVANTPARALRNEAGSVAFLWAMPDAATIIITTSEETLREIRDRMIAR